MAYLRLNKDTAAYKRAGHLKLYQQEGVDFISSTYGRALLGDEMGLGKTPQAVVWAGAAEALPCLVVCPSSVKVNWRREIYKWSGHKAAICRGKVPDESILNKDFIIINYDILGKWLPVLRKLRLKCVILDECHKIKNGKAQRTKAVRALAKGVPHVLGLSGTPILNKPFEFFQVLNLISPKLFPSEWSYARKFCNGHFDDYGWNTDGSSNTKELRELLKSVMIRRLKRDVLSELPPKVRYIVPLEMDNSVEYRYAKDSFLKWIKDKEGSKAYHRAKSAEPLVRAAKLKKLAAEGKLKHAISWIEDFLESGEKLIVFCTHTDILNKVYKHFKKVAVKIDGGTQDTKRQDIVDDFNFSKSVRLLVGNIKAAGEGLNLTKAANVAFLELGWTPGEHDQAEDRVHRIGQTAKHVFIWYLVAAGTIEEDIAKMLDEKREVIDAVLDGATTPKKAMLKYLINRMKGGGP